MPFVGELSYGDIVGLLLQQRERFTRPERQLLDSIVDYLKLKLATLPRIPDSKQTDLPFSE